MGVAHLSQSSVFSVYFLYWEIMLQRLYKSFIVLSNTLEHSLITHNLSKTNNGEIMLPSVSLNHNQFPLDCTGSAA